MKRTHLREGEPDVERFDVAYLQCTSQKMLEEFKK